MSYYGNQVFYSNCSSTGILGLEIQRNAAGGMAVEKWSKNDIKR
jgi:hypothetical protein